MSPRACGRDRPLRVLHIAHGKVFGGIETLLVTLARQCHLTPQMFPDFALCYDARVASELRSAGARVFMLGETRASRPYSVLRARAVLRDVLAATSYDIVVCHSVWPQAVFGPVVSRTILPLVFWQHGRLTGTHWTERWARRCRPSAALCNSYFTERTLDRVYPQLAREVVYCPVAPPGDLCPRTSRASVRKALGTSDSSIVIVQACRMERWKGHISLIRALGALRENSTWTCWLVGGAQGHSEEKYELELRAIAQSAGIGDRVVFCGQRSDVPDILAAADIFCQPNTEGEPFGIAFVEALLAGLPVAATSIGGAAEIVDETCGILVTAGCSEELGGALDHLLRDHALRARLAAGGRTRAHTLCDPLARLTQLAGVLASLVAFPATTEGCANEFI